ncbi:hypothetical protein EDD85DRAFT_826641 [Armillaria nabsnona]|nr:hypothetical protein EDD85DRAFT_826641 [Armillaria nabsnona]
MVHFAAPFFSHTPLNFPVGIVLWSVVSFSILYNRPIQPTLSSPFLMGCPAFLSPYMYLHLSSCFKSNHFNCCQ